MTSDKINKLLSKLNQILEDFQMLKDETWVPDKDSCDCSIENVKSIIYIIENEYNFPGKNFLRGGDTVHHLFCYNRPENPPL